MKGSKAAGQPQIGPGRQGVCYTRCLDPKTSGGARGSKGYAILGFKVPTTSVGQGVKVRGKGERGMW